ncbi:alpha/beta fold hydrolase [Zooshikella harenae]|uniref:Alpha/beta hydrolase n=1 Tax=Zooshikella harenae TaxID=2827238 RepID=A0ABS5ZCU7_9GAMM|nr:alpha/beta hydrolase [Zooshikella harenae]MBU2711824.1 alpha/beta hydrolase [Zooshikella harenae]
MSKTVFFLPGTMCDQRLWSKVWPRLKADYNPIHIPLPEAQNINNMLKTIIEKLPLKNINLVGFSLGGYIASALAINYPERMRRLMVIANSPGALPKSEILIRNKSLNWLKNNDYQGIPLAKIKKYLHAKNQDNQNIIKIITAMDLALGKTVLINQLSNTTLRDGLSEPLGQIDLPILFCAGEEDNLVNRTTLKALTTKNKNLQFFEVKNSGHMLPLEQPDRLVEIIHHWI